MLTSVAVMRVSAHPMPSTEIAMSLDDDGVRLDIALPVAELLLALPASFPKGADLLAEPQQRALAAYFDQHLSILSPENVRQPHRLEAVTLSQSVDANVGPYQELRLRVWVPATRPFNPREFVLAYDAIIHQVPNHFALVTIAHDFRRGLLAGGERVDLGLIRFDFSQNRTPPLPIESARGSAWQGFRSAIGLGFHHVSSGFDHVLFLLTLLAVAPLKVVDRRWSLFQGWRYAMRRFLGISIAFTAGHSVALLLGAHEVVLVPSNVVEIIIAASILLAAAHAIRPLFSGREWLVAAAFGTVHGLAFSDTLIGLNLTGTLRALAVLGFNLGVEGAQLVVMALALPLLAASRRRGFHQVRVAAMICVAVLATVWMVERVTGTRFTGNALTRSQF